VVATTLIMTNMFGHNKSLIGAALENRRRRVNFTGTVEETECPSRLRKKAENRLLARAAQKRGDVFATIYRAATARERTRRNLFRSLLESFSMRKIKDGPATPVRARYLQAGWHKI
jgi:hypothetical protein